MVFVFVIDSSQQSSLALSDDSGDDDLFEADTVITAKTKLEKLRYSYVPLSHGLAVRIHMFSIFFNPLSVNLNR